MRRSAIGILAHVDAGKTTLSEGLLYRSGRLKKLGRVDHRDAFLDTHDLERERGITIFSKQAVLPLPTLEITLLDTPGHVDFSTEMERTLQILDYAILVISGTDGIQGHTETLWRLLKRYHIPTFLFVNKMDLDGSDKGGLMEQLTARLGDGCVDFCQEEESWLEQLAMGDEGVMETYLDTGSIPIQSIAQMIAKRQIFPCYFGSALKLTGVDDFLQGLETYTLEKPYPKDFGARVYKIARDAQGARLTYLKVTGGSLKVKAPVVDGEKADQVRIYSGSKFQAVDQVPAGTVCAVTGLSKTYPGQGLGSDSDGDRPALEPVLTYRVGLPQGCQPQVALPKLAQLEEEDPLLRVTWNPRLGEIQMGLMGQVQLEILRRVIEERFDLAVEFDAGRIVYRETILEPVIGVGHYEPLRHYAEVHILMEPGESGSGLVFDTTCSQDVLDGGWQRLILTHLGEKPHLGVLAGFPITDMKLTLVAGRGHLKHTEGGDFRQATYRAVRQGLMQAQSQLLEPYYRFRIEVPTANVGRLMADMQRLFGTFDPPETLGDTALLVGKAPVATLRDYAQEVTAYTKGLGRVTYTPGGYHPCHNPEEVMADFGYDPQRDLENPADSVFCAHGAGFAVKWDEVSQYQHLESSLPSEPEPEPEPDPQPVRYSRHSYTGGLAEDKELQAIFERTYGAVKRKDFLPQSRPTTTLGVEKVAIRPPDNRPEYLLVDGYNMIFAWDDLKALAQDHIESARQRLMEMMCNYQGFKQCKVIVVFDAYKVPKGVGSVTQYNNIHVVYTKEAETADAYIEKTTYELAGKYRVRVATSDGIEQLIILGHGALRVSARTFRMEVDSVETAIASLMRTNNQKNRGQRLGDAIQAAQNKVEEKG